MVRRKCASRRNFRWADKGRSVQYQGSLESIVLVVTNQVPSCQGLRGVHTRHASLTSTRAGHGSQRIVLYALLGYKGDMFSQITAYCSRRKTGESFNKNVNGKQNQFPKAGE